MFIPVVFTVWLSSAYVEYKIVSPAPAYVQKWFHNPIGGIIMSILIGTAVGYALGMGNGVMVGIANAVGLATNNLTYPAFAALARWNVKRKEVQAQVVEFKTAHPSTFNQAVDGFKLLFKTIGMICFGIVWVCGIPSRISQWVTSTKSKLHLTKAR